MALTLIDKTRASILILMASLWGSRTTGDSTVFLVARRPFWLSLDQSSRHLNDARSRHPCGDLAFASSANFQKNNLYHGSTLGVYHRKMGDRSSGWGELFCLHGSVVWHSM